MTVAGTVLGSPLYMSPEQARGQLDTDHRTDVYAFGAILFEAICGYRCYDAPNFNALIVADSRRDRAEEHRPKCAPQMPESCCAPLVRDCLATDKAKRLDSFDAVIACSRPFSPSSGRIPFACRRPRGGPTRLRATPSRRAPCRPSSDRARSTPFPRRPRTRRPPRRGLAPSEDTARTRSLPSCSSSRRGRFSGHPPARPSCSCSSPTGASPAGAGRGQTDSTASRSSELPRPLRARAGSRREHRRPAVRASEDAPRPAVRRCCAARGVHHRCRRPRPGHDADDVAGCAAGVARGSLRDHVGAREDGDGLGR